MDFLYENFIANMYGPTFLGFYIAVIAIICIGLQVSIGFFDSTQERDAPKIPQEIDPYQVAYLRGGGEELIKVILFSLVSRGYLKLSEQLTFVIKELNGPPYENLLPVEEEVLRFVGDRTPVKAIMEYSVLHGNLKNLASVSFEYEREENELIHSSQTIKKFYNLRNWGIAIILFLGSYKFIIALMKGKSNVGFLIILAVVGLVITFKTTFPRLTRKGEAFLKNLQTAFNTASVNNPETLNPFNQVLLASIFGFALVNIPEFEFIRTYERTLTRSSSSGDSGSCGSSCGSSCGGGCGGGCGGCS